LFPSRKESVRKGRDLRVFKAIAVPPIMYGFAHHIRGNAISLLYRLCVFTSFKLVAQLLH
jgi:hypothetical protein